MTISTLSWKDPKNDAFITNAPSTIAGRRKEGNWLSSFEATDAVLFPIKSCPSKISVYFSREE